MSGENNRLELLKAYATEQFSSNDNKIQALINTVHWVVKFAEDLPNTSEQVDQIIVDMKRLFIGDGLNRSEGDFFIGNAIMVGTGGFQEELQDGGNQIQHAVAGLCGSLYTPAFGFAGGVWELVTAATRDEPVNQPDIELYSRMHSFASEIHIFGIEGFVEGLIREIGDDTVVHPNFLPSVVSGTTILLENFEPEPEPQLRIETTNAVEGDTLFFRVHIDGDVVEHDISFRAITFQGTSSEFDQNGLSPDYVGVNAIYTIPAGQSEIWIPVETDDDVLLEYLETVELVISDIQGAGNSVLVGIGTIVDDDPAEPSFEAINFSTDLSGVLPTASYTISHDDAQDRTGTKVNAYVDSNGNGVWDSEDAHVGYESASTLRVGENDAEVIDLDDLRDHVGDQTLFITALSDTVPEHVIHTEDVAVEAINVNFTLDNFQWSPDGENTRVDYNISHDFNGELTGVRVQWYADANGNGVWDAEDDYLGYESAGTLSDGEVDSEYEIVEDLGSYSGSGDVLIFTTVQADGIDRHVHRTDVVDMAGNNGPDIDLTIEDITFREDRLLTTGQDVRADFVVVNSGSVSTEGMQESTGIFWSADDQFDFNEDTMIDADTHGTLYAGEHDSEYERTHYEDIPEGQGYLFYVVDPLNMIAETNEANNVSDPFMVWVL